MDTPSPPKSDKSTRFVDFIIKACASSAVSGKLRYADNPATEYRSWELLVRVGINLNDDADRLPAALIAAAIAKGRVTSNGTLSLGAALARAHKEKIISVDSARARLLRLLASTDTAELCRFLRPLLHHLQGISKDHLDYALLLRQLRWFEDSPDRTKAMWAQAFYGQIEQSEEAQA